MSAADCGEAVFVRVAAMANALAWLRRRYHITSNAPERLHLIAENIRICAARKEGDVHGTMAATVWWYCLYEHLRLDDLSTDWHAGIQPFGTPTAKAWCARADSSWRRICLKAG